MRSPTGPEIIGGIGLGSLAWGFCNAIYKAPVMTAFCCGVLVLIGLASGVWSPHEAGFMAFWFIGIFCVVGTGVLALNGRLFMAAMAVLGVSTVLMIMSDHGFIIGDKHGEAFATIYPVNGRCEAGYVPRSYGIEDKTTGYDKIVELCITKAHNDREVAEANKSHQR